MSICIRAILADGREFEGPIQGNGGKLGDGIAYMGKERATGAAIDQILKVQRLHAAGRPAGVYEPRPGHVAIYPDWTSWGDGAPVVIPLEGTVFEAAPKRWNRRYLAYAKAHGETDPEAMLERDRKQYPGGRMCGFTLWMGERWHEWRGLKGYKRDCPLGPEDHGEFDVWLAARTAELAETIRRGIEWIQADDGQEPDAFITHHGIYSGPWELALYKFSMSLCVGPGGAPTFTTSSRMDYIDMPGGYRDQPNMPDNVWEQLKGMVRATGVSITREWAHNHSAFSCTLGISFGKAFLDMHSRYGKRFCESCPRLKDNDPCSVFCNCDFIIECRDKVVCPDGWG